MSHSVRTIAINLAVLCGLALLVEVGIRVWYFSRTCAKSACDYRVFTLVNFHDVSQENSSIDHERLGHLPHPGRYAVNEKGWSGQIVVIEEDSTRSNGQPAPTRTGPRLLAVGDSFTFGAQVADAETWPAALERILSAPVVNAGVNGYGFAQAALRGRLLLAEHAYDLVILSAYAPDDFLRDRLLTRYSSRKPAWVERDGTVT
ncbi:MAG: hypothetical protein OEY85_12765, partial [Rhodospirillales bacterium]|nr:hypothetical protein [Rhodospirillales bacterium]